MPRKDPNKPKGVKSAYICFSEHQRKEFEKDGKSMPFAEFSTLCSTKWKALSEEDKKPFQEISDEDRKRHQKEMENYNPPSDSDSDDDRPRKKKKSKEPKDVNAPKKPLTAYFHFTAKVRPEVKDAFPDLSVTEIAKKLGERWRNLPEEEKEPYTKKAEEDKIRYQKEMLAYTK